MAGGGLAGATEGRARPPAPPDLPWRGISMAVIVDAKYSLMFGSVLSLKRRIGIIYRSSLLASGFSTWGIDQLTMYYQLTNTNV